MADIVSTRSPRPMQSTSASTIPPGRRVSRARSGRAAWGLALALALAPPVASAGRASQGPAAPGARIQDPKGQDPEARDPQAQEAAARAKAAEAARLKADFDRYTLELRAAIAGFQNEIAGLQQHGVSREKWPPHPNVVHYPRFEELAVQDQPDALRWCITTVGQLGLDAAAAAEKKNEIYARLVVVHPDQPWMADIARWIQSDATAAGIGFERADELLRVLADATRVRATRAAALASRSALLSTRTDPASRAEYAQLLRELAEKHGDTPAGAAARGEIFRAEYLVPGRTPPDVVAVDVEGQSFRLADYRGKVLVLDFWGFWCGACVRSLPHLKELARVHAADPFALVGVATDADLPEFRSKARENGVTWRNAWAGGTMGTWPVSWGVQRYPTLYVLDANGVVRFVDVRGEDLGRAVKTLLGEMRAAKAAGPR